MLALKASPAERHDHQDPAMRAMYIEPADMEIRSAVAQAYARVVVRIR
jgi:hypothetical protein